MLISYGLQVAALYGCPCNANIAFWIPGLAASDGLSLCFAPCVHTRFNSDFVLAFCRFFSLPVGLQEASGEAPRGL